LRNNANLTQGDLAKILGVNKSSVQKYEGGSVCNLKMETIRSLCNLFNVTPYAFVFPELIQNEKDLKGVLNDNHLLSIVSLLSELNTIGKEKILAYTQDLIDTNNYKN